ncbi:MAG: cation:proton antiporter, partial [Castellaniella sp.]
MNLWFEHLPALPVLIPLLTAALMLLTRDNQRPVRVALGAVSLGLQVLVALALVRATQGIGRPAWPDGVGVYLLGNWPAPFGIVLVADRLSALMLGLAAVLGTCAWVYATARW